MLESFRWYRRLKGGTWFLCELPAYDCSGLYRWRRMPSIHEQVIEKENWRDTEAFYEFSPLPMIEGAQDVLSGESRAFAMGFEAGRIFCLMEAGDTLDLMIHRDNMDKLKAFCQKLKYRMMIVNAEGYIIGLRLTPLAPVDADPAES